MTKAGFYLGDPYAPLNKHYPYHGINRKCPKPPAPDPFYDIPVASEPGWFVFTLGHSFLTQGSVILEGELQATGEAQFIMCGFEYGPADGSWYLIVWEMGTFTDYHYFLTIFI
jgi:hypothetical protein